VLYGAAPIFYPLLERSLELSPALTRHIPTELDSVAILYMVCGAILIWVMTSR